MLRVGLGVPVNVVNCGVVQGVTNQAAALEIWFDMV
jgi:hypothetical protein